MGELRLGPHFPSDGHQTSHWIVFFPGFLAKARVRNITGARNTFDVVNSWPELVSAMDPIRHILCQEVCRQPELQGVAQACGPNPSRSPPSEDLVAAVRAKVGRLLKIPSNRVEDHHEASPWRWKLVQAVQSRAADPDQEIVSWLRDGAPVGIAREVVPGGLLPAIEEEATATEEDISTRQAYDSNHRSFDQVYDGKQPALEELKKLLDMGFAELFVDAAAAESKFGDKVVISPLGDVVKTKLDGTLKHRLIQDFKASEVNGMSVVQERQVLPRFQDHGADLAKASQDGDELGVFILDFKHAFMTIPLHPAERRFNASIVPAGSPCGSYGSPV